MTESNAIKRLKTRLLDANRLVEIHEECTGDAPGRRRGYDALNRSAIILAVAAWEGFAEDALGRAVAHISRRAKGPGTLPERVRNAMLAHMYEQDGWSTLNQRTKNSVWGLAGRGWRLQYIEYGKAKISAINTPNHANIKKAFSSLIGLEDFSNLWGAKRWKKDNYISKLDDMLNLRHRIAHGVIGDETIGKGRSKSAIALVERIAGWTDKAIDAHLTSMNLSPMRNSKQTKNRGE